MSELLDGIIGGAVGGFLVFLVAAAINGKSNRR